MQRTKTFFYVSLGILALGVAFQMGAQTARGQSGIRVSVYAATGNALGMQWAADDVGGLYTTQDQVQPWSFFHQFSDRIVGIDPGGFYVVLINGDVYWRRGATGEWEIINNIFRDLPVQASETTWGRVKAERR